MIAACRRIVLGSLLGFALAGCAGQPSEAAIRRYLSVETDAFARSFIDSLRSGRPDAAQRYLVRPLDTAAAVRDTLAAMGATFAPGRPHSVDLAQLRRTTFDNRQTQFSLAYQLRGGAGTTLVQLVVLERGNQRLVQSAHVERLEVPLQLAHALTLNGKGAGHYLVILLTFGIVAFSLFAAWRVASTRSMPRRWLWALVACFGVGKFVFNWTTGALSGNILAGQLLGVSFGRVGLLGPWLLAFSFPIGAIVALERRKRYLQNAHPLGAQINLSEPQTGDGSSAAV